DTTRLQVESLLARHAPTLPSASSQRAALGLAHAVCSTAWSVQRRVNLQDNRLEILDRGTTLILEEPSVPAFAVDLQQLANNLRNGGVPTGLRSARDAYERARADFLAEA